MDWNRNFIITKRLAIRIVSMLAFFLLVFGLRNVTMNMLQKEDAGFRSGQYELIGPDVNSMFDTEIEQLKIAGFSFSGGYNSDAVREFFSADSSLSLLTRGRKFESMFQLMNYLNCLGRHSDSYRVLRHYYIVHREDKESNLRLLAPLIKFTETHYYWPAITCFKRYQLENAAWLATTGAKVVLAANVNTLEIDDATRWRINRMLLLHALFNERSMTLQNHKEILGLLDTVQNEIEIRRSASDSLTDNPQTQDVLMFRRYWNGVCTFERGRYEEARPIFDAVTRYGGNPFLSDLARLMIARCWFWQYDQDSEIGMRRIAANNIETQLRYPSNFEDDMESYCRILRLR